jgi:hypothetical protein
MKKYVAAIALAAVCFAAGDGGHSALAHRNGRAPHDGRGSQECKASIRAAGSSNVMRRLARLSAVNAWGKEAEAASGPQYASWDRARSKTVSCKSLGRVSVRCVARAKPCKQ